MKKNKKNQLPSAAELKKIFTEINEDCKGKGESVVPLNEEEYYAEQIQNIFECTYEEAKILAYDLARA